jgi:hypothetical protein
MLGPIKGLETIFVKVQKVSVLGFEWPLLLLNSAIVARNKAQTKQEQINRPLFQ